MPELQTIHVAIDGDDHWTGSLVRPNAALTDGPCATLARALEATRALPADTPRRIVLHSGRYYGVSLVLDARDSGLTIEAAHGEQPILYGGQPVTQWTREWNLDHTRRQLGYWPLPGEDTALVDTIAATETCIIRFDGRPEAPVNNVTLQDLTLEATTTPLIAADVGAEALYGAITGNGPLRDCSFKNLTVKNVAGHGIKLRGTGTRNIQIEGCAIETAGAGGIYLTADDSVIGHNVVEHIGVMYPSAIGIYFGGDRNAVIHNDIRDTSYSGVGAGAGTGNRIEYNRCAQVLRLLNDGGAIHALANRGAIIRGNVAADISSGPGVRCAYYLDELCENCLVAENLAVDVPWWLHNHMARHNTIRNNVCIVHGDAKVSFMRSQDYSVERNIIYATGAIRFVGVEGVARFDQNIFYSGEDWVEGVHLVDDVETDDVVVFTSDDKTRMADPLFVDGGHGDLRFQADSPAYALGIAPLEVGRAGRRA